MEQTTKLPLFDETAPYTIARAYYQEGFRAYQKRFVLRRNRIMMGIFFLLLISFVAAAAADPDVKMTYFLIMLCLAALFLLWYNPRKQRRMVMDAVKELADDQYTAICDGNLLRIRTVLEDAESDSQTRVPESRISLASAWVKEFPAFYLICKGREIFYILPKDAIPSADHPTPEKDT